MKGRRDGRMEEYGFMTCEEGRGKKQKKQVSESNTEEAGIREQY